MNGLQKPAVHHLHEVVVLSSTDEEEANRDLTLDILERARRCREKRQVTKKNKRKKSKKKAEYDGVVVDLITTSSDESEVSRKSKRRKKRIKKLEKSAKNHQVFFSAKSQDPFFPQSFFVICMPILFMHYADSCP